MTNFFANEIFGPDETYEEVQIEADLIGFDCYE